MKGIISRQIPHTCTCSSSPKQGAFKLISRLTGLCYFIPFLDLKSFLLKSTPFPHTHRKTTGKKCSLKMLVHQGWIKKKTLYSNLSVLMCVIWYQTSLGSHQPPKIIVYSTLSLALFPKKMGAALLLGKSPGTRLPWSAVHMVQSRPRPNLVPRLFSLSKGKREDLGD